MIRKAGILLVVLPLYVLGLVVIGTCAVLETLLRRQP